METLLKELEAKWQEVSGYDDIEAALWTPGKAIADKCPHGCRLTDTGWRPMSADEEGAEGHRRTVFCKSHGYARIYAIDAATAGEHGWEPLPTT
jgi:hypothetical protein